MIRSFRRWVVLGVGGGEPRLRFPAPGSGSSCPARGSTSSSRGDANAVFWVYRLWSRLPSFFFFCFLLNSEGAGVFARSASPMVPLADFGDLRWAVRLNATTGPACEPISPASRAVAS